MDHVTPLVHKGRFRAKENTVLSCRACNNKKAQLIMEDLGDLSPEQLWIKFDRTVKDAQSRKGHYREWVTEHYDTVPV